MTVHHNRLDHIARIGDEDPVQYPKRGLRDKRPIDRAAL